MLKIKRDSTWIMLLIRASQARGPTRKNMIHNDIEIVKGMPRHYPEDSNEPRWGSEHFQDNNLNSIHISLRRKND